MDQEKAERRFLEGEGWTNVPPDSEVCFAATPMGEAAYQTSSYLPASGDIRAR